MIPRKLLIASLVLVSFSSSAQESASNKDADNLEPRIGFKGGLSIATIIKSNSNNFSSDPLFGFNGGGVLQLPFGKVVGLQPEILFSQKGYRATGSDLVGGTYNYRRYLNFLDIPILLRLNASRRFGLVFGPQYSFLLTTNTSFNSGAASYQQTIKNDNDNITKNIFGGVIGADLNINHNLFFYARYMIDFKNNNGDGTSSTPSYKNQVAEIGFGVLL